MIAFASLFLGLVVGTAQVQVLVDASTASVAFELDGNAVGRATGAPWTASIDFGPELLPHELVARSFSKEGRETGVARQFVNLPRPPAEVEVLLERDLEGHPIAARFTGESLIAFRPARATVTFDGKPLPVQEAGRVVLPPHDPEARHVLSVALEFSSAIRTRADLVFGAGVSSFARSELTAVPVRWTSVEAASGPPGLDGVFRHAGRPLRVAALEELPALVCVVRAPRVDEALKVLGTGGKTNLVMLPGTARRLPQFDRDASRSAMALEKEDRLKFIWPMARAAGTGAQLFDMSRELLGSDAGIHWDLTRIEHPGPYSKQLRLADAAAVAGLEASASGSRRAVVLVLGDEKEDVSRETPSSVRHYLEAIGVPFFVWSLKRPASQPLAKAWSPVEDISSFDKLDQAVSRLKAALAEQHIVWLEGRYLPQNISVADDAAGVALIK